MDCGRSAWTCCVYCRQFFAGIWIVEAGEMIYTYRKCVCGHYKHFHDRLTWSMGCVYRGCKCKKYALAIHEKYDLRSTPAREEEPVSRKYTGITS